MCLQMPSCPRLGGVRAVVCECRHELWGRIRCLCRPLPDIKAINS